MRIKDSHARLLKDFDCLNLENIGFKEVEDIFDGGGWFYVCKCCWTDDFDCITIMNIID